MFGRLSEARRLQGTRCNPQTRSGHVPRSALVLAGLYCLDNQPWPLGAKRPMHSDNHANQGFRQRLADPEFAKTALAAATVVVVAVLSAVALAANAIYLP